MRVNELEGHFVKYSKEIILESEKICEVYYDGEKKDPLTFCDGVGSYNIFMHTLVLSINTNLKKLQSGQFQIYESEDERAIARYALIRGFDKDLIDSVTPRVNLLDADIEPVLIPSIHLINDKYRVVIKASPLEILDRCSMVLKDLRIVKLSRKIKKDIYLAITDMLNRGLKVYAIAIRDLTVFNEKLLNVNITNEMTFVGMIGIGEA